MAIPWVVGQAVTATDLNAMSNPDTSLVGTGTIARGRRTTATGSIVGTETGVMRLDSVPVYAGRGYFISTSCINMDTSVNNDICATILHINQAGTATTASTILTTLRQTVDDATNSNIVPLNAFYYPSSSGSLSLLLSAVRVTGTGNLVVFCSGSQPLDFVVIDIGFVPADTAVIL